MIHKLFFLALGVLSIGITHISCSKKEDPALPPSIELLNKNGEEYKDSIVKPGTSINIYFKVQKNGDDLRQFRIYKNGALINNPYNKIIDLYTIFAKDKIFDSLYVESDRYDTLTVEYTFEAISTQKASSSKKINIKYYDPIAATTWGNFVIFDDSSSNSKHKNKDGAFYATLNTASNDSSLLESQAVSYMNTIACCFIYDYATQKYYLHAPSTEEAAKVYPSLKNWTQRNATKFITTTLTRSQFENAKGSDIVAFAKAAGVDNGDTSIELKYPVNTTYAMKTADGKYSLFFTHGLYYITFKHAY